MPEEQSLPPLQAEMVESNSNSTNVAQSLANNNDTNTDQSMAADTTSTSMI